MAAKPGAKMASRARHLQRAMIDCASHGASPATKDMIRSQEGQLFKNRSGDTTKTATTAPNGAVVAVVVVSPDGFEELTFL